MAGNAGKGREQGSRNRRTLALLELAEQGETPCAFALRVMRDETTPLDLKIQAARIAAPYIHPKPQPDPRMVAFDVPAAIKSAESLLVTHGQIFSAMAAGSLAVEDARNISTMLETHRRLVDTVDLEQRLYRLEQERKP